MSQISLFEEKQVRRAWNAEQEKWMFAIVDVIAILTGSTNPQTYWRVLKKRLNDEGNETVTKCNGLKMTAADGKQRMTDGTLQYLWCVEDEWKLIVRYDGEDTTQYRNVHTWDKARVRLYRIKDDPHEKHDVSAKHPEVVERIKKRIADWHAACGS
jgi:hypothetical protein